tara:strand:+ start:528 stop:659 length:132 start_codon:yes stop_codon:yes gene_type:complete
MELERYSHKQLQVLVKDLYNEIDNLKVYVKELEDELEQIDNGE